MSEGKEIVLPSGRFAHIRPVTWFDRALCENKNAGLMCLMVAIRCTTIDGEPLTADEAMSMPIRDANPIIEAIARELVEGAASKGVA